MTLKQALSAKRELLALCRKHNVTPAVHEKAEGAKLKKIIIRVELEVEE